MKKIIVLISLIFVMICSCDRSPGYVNFFQEYRESFQDMARVNIQVKDGYISYVMNGEDTIVKTTIAGDYLLPVKKNFSRAEDGDIVQFQLNTTGWAGQSSNLYQIVCFEDTRNGDHDYNDLIIHNNYQFSRIGSQYKFRVRIHPIAYGATKTIGLGFCLLSHDGTTVLKDTMISDNTRRDLFKNKQGFINTERYDWHCAKFMKVIDINFPVAGNPGNMMLYWIRWYIIVDGRKLYAFNGTSENGADYLYDSVGYPQGIAICKIENNNGAGFIDPDGHTKVGLDWFAFPMERVNINQAYNIFGGFGWNESSKIKASSGYIFDIANTNPIENESKRSYRIYDIDQ